MGFGGFGPWEMFLIFVVVLLLFGAKRLPEIGSSLGKGIREFKSSVREIESELKVPEEPQRIHRTSPPPTDQQQQQQEGEPRKLSESAPTASEPAEQVPEEAEAG